MKNPLKLYREASPAVRSALWFTICNFLQRGTALIVVPIFTRLLTSAQYGICNLYFAWFDIFVLFTSLKLPYEGLNNGLIRHEEDKDGYTGAIQGLIMVLTIAAGLLYWLVRDWVDSYIGLSGFLMLVMFVQLLLNPSLNLWTNRARFDFNYRWPVVVTLVCTIANPVIAVIAVLNTEYMAEARILSLALVQCSAGLVCAVLLFARGKRFFNKKYWRFALGFNLPLLPYYLSQTLLNQSDRIMINYFGGSGQAAIYSVAYTAGTLMLLLTSAVNGSFMPWIYRKIKDGKSDEVGTAVGGFSLVVGAATVAMMVFAPDIVALLATQEYAQAVWIIPPVAASVFFIFVYMQFANVEMYYGENRGITWISLTAAAANIVLNAVLIPIFGYLAAGWTTLASYMLLAMLHYVLMKKACRKHQTSGAIFPEKLLLLLSFGVVALAGLILVLYGLGYVRYGVFLMEVILIFCFRKRLFQFLKSMK